MPDANATVRALREAQGLTPADLAEATGLSLSTVLRIENGSEFRTNANVAALVAEALGVEIDALFDHKDLSHLGRPPLTGRAIHIEVEARAHLACQCGMQLAAHAQECFNCGEPT